MDRCAVLVDAGYLLGAAGTLLAGDADRAALVVDYAALVADLIQEAEQQTGMPVLRVLWYDGARDAQPTPEHRALRVLPDVKLRLGELVKRGVRWQQKGVDSYLQRDLTALARNHAVADVVLLGGDEDLRRALEEAQDFGIRAHLWGVEAAAPEYNQSQSLIAEADRRWVVPEEWIRRYVSLRESTASESPSATLSPANPEKDRPSAPPAPVAAPAPIQVEQRERPRTPTPADLARLAEQYSKERPAVRSVDASQGGWQVHRDDHDDAPRLRELTNARESWQDNEQDATEATTNPAEVGERFGTRWGSRANADAREALLARHPMLPRHLDGELLRYAEKMGVDTWEDEAAKFAVRAGFWEALEGAGGDPAS